MKAIKFLSVAAVAMLAACSRQEVVETANGYDGEYCYLPLNLSVAPEQSGTPDTEAAFTKAIVDESADIQNVWVIQYDGTGDDAPLVGVASYIESYDGSDPEHSTVKLVPSSEVNTIVFLANTYRPDLVFGSDSNLGDLKKRRMDVSSQQDIFGNSDDGDSHIMFNGIVEMKVEPTTTSVSCTLKRNISRIILNLKNSSTGTEAVTIRSVELRGVPAFSYYMTNYASRPAVFPAASAFASDDLLTGYANTAWDSAGGDEQTFTFYAPANARGTSVNITAESEKMAYSPDGLATYAFVTAEYTQDGNTYPIVYSFCLGENMTDNYDLKPNFSYTYNIDIKGKGSSSDARVEDLGIMDFSASNMERANCYILNPPPVDGYMREFRIPVDRVNVFWGADPETRGLYENDPTYQIAPGDSWVVTPLWSDFEISEDKFRISQSSDPWPDNNYFTVQVAKGVSGNVVVAIKVTKDGATEYAWSWHLWITDYNPDSPHAAAIDNMYSYPVDGGKLYRMKGTMWATGSLKDGFIMDRNLGSLSDGYPAGGNGRGCLFYQFGRKDPFWGGYSVYKYSGPYAGYNSTLETFAAGENSNVEKSVHKPMTFFTGTSYWTSGDKYNPSTSDATIVWQDPNTRSGGKIEGQKSLFDPCPPGWRVPQSGVYSDMRANSNATPTTNIGGVKRGFTSFSQAYSIGLRYWPYVLNTAEDYTVSEQFYFPASGIRNNNKGGLSNAGSNGYYWYGSPSSASNGSRLNFGSGSLNVSGSNARAFGFSVRCVSEQ